MIVSLKHKFSKHSLRTLVYILPASVDGDGTGVVQLRHLYHDLGLVGDVGKSLLHVDTADAAVRVTRPVKVLALVDTHIRQALH